MKTNAFWLCFWDGPIHAQSWPILSPLAGLSPHCVIFLPEERAYSSWRMGVLSEESHVVTDNDLSLNKPPFEYRHRTVQPLLSRMPKVSQQLRTSAYSQETMHQLMLTLVGLPCFWHHLSTSCSLELENFRLPRLLSKWLRYNRADDRGFPRLGRRICHRSMASQ